MESFKGIISMKTLMSTLKEQLDCSEEELDFKNVPRIDLEFKEIVKITCLWPLTNLTHLNLSNNCLKRIENLDELVNLKNLNLSFNEIVKIENIHKLTKLETLSLYWNFIETIDNLDSLSYLEIFNIGKNKINAEDLHIYFRKFANLRSLAVEENPCCDRPTTEELIIAFVPQLIFLNYKKITLQQKYIYSTKFKLELARMKKFEMAELQEQKRQERDSKKHSFEGVISGSEFFDKMFSSYGVLLKFTELGEDFSYLNHNLKKKLVNVFQNLQILLETNYTETKRILQQYIDDVLDLENKSVILKRSIIKNSIPRIRAMKETADGNMDSNSSSNVLFKLRIKLLAEECDMHSRFEKYLEKLENDLDTRTTESIHQIDGVFENISVEEDNYVSLMFKNIKKKSRNVIKDILSDQETLLFVDENSIDTFSNNFQDYNTKLLNETRMQIVKQVKNWKVHPEFTQLEEKKILRHRKAVAEIIECIKLFQNDELITV
ncbi:dynein regulatory complex subunit 3-like [Planococcus citri]|uniref:dynein regulatory complex subunit 3-like n=1 Tax=Planococcus citri TaxID=170843 RepID=UPI0031F7696B